MNYKTNSVETLVLELRAERKKKDPNHNKFNKGFLVVLKQVEQALPQCEVHVQHEIALKVIQGGRPERSSLKTYAFGQMRSLLDTEHQRNKRHEEHVKFDDAPIEDASHNVYELTPAHLMIYAPHLTSIQQNTLIHILEGTQPDNVKYKTGSKRKVDLRKKLKELLNA